MTKELNKKLQMQKEQSNFLITKITKKEKENFSFDF